ncbi:hypothetical protein [Nocardiopsis sp. CA-288880]|uniref:hypothetical protein n=1 Tax=Nocardiopsis sp. CA-288880 TaxID=3239995 RepID=UPI003D99283E
MTRALFALKLRLFRDGPHDERVFSLVTGLILAALVIAGASSATHGVIHEGWIAVALTVWGGMWLFGPLAQPRHEPSVISHEWLRGYPLRPWRLARALSWTELLGVGPLVTLACLSSLVVLAAPGGAAAVVVAMAAVAAFVCRRRTRHQPRTGGGKTGTGLQRRNPTGRPGALGGPPSDDRARGRTGLCGFRTVPRRVQLPSAPRRAALAAKASRR